MSLDAGAGFKKGGGGRGASTENMGLGGMPPKAAKKAKKEKKPKAEVGRVYSRSRE